jgi:hypothetical protein
VKFKNTRVAICHNQLVHNFRGHRKTLDKSLTGQHLRTSHFYKNVRRIFFLIHIQNFGLQWYIHLAAEYIMEGKMGGIEVMGTQVRRSKQLLDDL